MKTFYILLALLSFNSYSALNEPVTIEKIEQYLASHKINTLPDFLKYLPSDIRSRYTLVRSSSSLQGGSYQDPRVIMYSKNSQFLFSFNGGKHQRGGETVELFVFTDKNEFEPHELDFSGAQVKINKKPQKCMGCHGMDFRPNWNNEGFWQGAYGENNNKLVSRKRSIHDTPTTKDFYELEKFKFNHKKHPRFKYLKDLGLRYKLDKTIYNENDLFSAQLINRPNSELTELISQMNFKRMTSLIKEMKNYNHFKYSFLALMSCSYENFLKSLGRVDIGYKPTPLYNISDYKRPLKIGPIFDDYMQAFQMTFNVYARSPLDTNMFFRYHWNLGNFDLYDSITRFSTPGDSGEEFAAIFANSDPELKAFITKEYRVGSFKPGGIQRAVIDCVALAQKSSQVIEIK